MHLKSSVVSKSISGVRIMKTSQWRQWHSNVRFAVATQTPKICRYNIGKYGLEDCTVKLCVLSLWTTVRRNKLLSPPTKEEVNVFASVCLSVCLSVC